MERLGCGSAALLYFRITTRSGCATPRSFPPSQCPRHFPISFIGGFRLEDESKCRGSEPNVRAQNDSPRDCGSNPLSGRFGKDDDVGAHGHVPLRSEWETSLAFQRLLAILETLLDLGDACPCPAFHIRTRCWQESSSLYRAAIAARPRWACRPRQRADWRHDSSFDL